MVKARHAGEIVYKKAASGFIVEGSWAYIPEHNEPREDLPPCVYNSCRDSDCAEWPDVWLLPGVTRQEAEAALARRECDGMAYHVPECELLDGPETPEEGAARVAALKAGLAAIREGLTLLEETP